jgi:hypothetical protein
MNSGQRGRTKLDTRNIASKKGDRIHWIGTYLTLLFFMDPTSPLFFFFAQATDTAAKTWRAQQVFILSKDIEHYGSDSFAACLIG